MDNLLRILHLVHSLDILVAYRSIDPRRGSRVIPFILKFALFVCVNTLHSLTGIPFPSVQFDELTTSDFALLFVLVEVLWGSAFLRSTVRLLKGDISQLSQYEKSFRLIHTLLFTAFRLIAGQRMLVMFSDHYWQSLLVTILFLEFNGVILKLLKGERNLKKLSASMVESVVVGAVASIHPMSYVVLAYTLVNRHLIPVLKQLIVLK